MRKEDCKRLYEESLYANENIGLSHPMKNKQENNKSLVDNDTLNEMIKVYVKVHAVPWLLSSRYWSLSDQVICTQATKSRSWMKQVN